MKNDFIFFFLNKTEHSILELNRKSQLGRWPKKKKHIKEKFFFFFLFVFSRDWRLHKKKKNKKKTPILGCKQIKPKKKNTKWIMKFQVNALMTSTAGTFWWFKKKKSLPYSLVSDRHFLFYIYFFFLLLFFT